MAYPPEIARNLISVFFENVDTTYITEEITGDTIMPGKMTLVK